MSNNHYEKLITNKWQCTKCKYYEMYPNNVDDKIKGFKCNICGKVNYPIKDYLKYFNKGE